MLPGAAPPLRLISKLCSPAPRPLGPSRSSALLSILSSPREALGHVPRPDKDHLGAGSAARNLAICAAGAAALAGPGDARSLPGGNRNAAPPLPPPPSALRAGVAAGSPGSLSSPPLPFAFVPGASSRGAPASRRPRAPSPLPPARRPRSPLQAPPPPEGYAPRRRGAGDARPHRRLRRRPPQRPPRRAAPGRPGCRLLPPQSRLLNQSGEARPPPTRLPELPGPRLAARAPSTPGPPSSSRRAIGCGAPPAFT